MTIRALIVDDEPLAREKIRTLLADDDDVQIVGECGDGRSAARAIRESDPDLVFLDVQMPEMDGFATLEAADREDMPVIVFVTAYDQYALKAFDVHALDYLLKPFDRDRFQAALERAKRRLRDDGADATDDRILKLLREFKQTRESGWLERLVVKARGRVFFVPVEQVDWIEAAGNYVQLHVGDESHLIRSTMKGLEEKLDPSRFIRVHRSAMVNISRIKEIQPWFNGEYTITLESGANVTTGQSHRETLRSLMENPA